jgi:hypothetical protein
MKQLNELVTAPEPLDSSAGTLAAPLGAASGSGTPPSGPDTAPAAKTTPVQIALVALGVVAFLYLARPVVLPVFF